MILSKMQDDVTIALKSGDKAVVETLRFALSELKNKAIEKRAVLTDEEVTGALSGMIKKLNDSIVQFETAGRGELSALYKNQVAILQEYLPEEISDEELEKVVKTIIEANQELKTNLGALIGKSIGALKGKASPTRIAETVKRLTQTSG